MLRLSDVFDKLGERFGYIKAGPGRIWIHAASVGEVGVAKLFVDGLKASRPDLSFHISTNTRTGRAYAAKRFIPTIGSLSYLPFDFGGCVARAFDRIAPSALVLIEQELWPNLIGTAKKRDVKVVVINGRITERSALRYKRYGYFLNGLRKVDLVLAQSDQYSERFKAIGLENVVTTGNMKYDIKFESAVDYKKLFGISDDDFVIVAGSTHAPEEKILIDAFKRLQSIAKNARLIIAPRYYERLPEVEKIVASAGLKCYKMTQLERTDGVILVDTMGELAKIYSVATVAFVGGTIARRGGHNLAEPAFWGKPILAGESLYNFSDLTERLAKLGALKVATTADSIYNELIGLLKSPQECNRFGALAKSEISASSGAVKKSVDEFIRLTNF